MLRHFIFPFRPLLIETFYTAVGLYNNINILHRLFGLGMKRGECSVGHGKCLINHQPLTVPAKGTCM